MNQELPPPEESRPPKPDGPTHSPRTWRTCCLVPSIALALILVIGTITMLNNTARHRISVQPMAHRSRREAFIGFANDYFAIARRADLESKAAFTVLHNLDSGNAKVEEMHEAFRHAAEANRQASAEFKNLAIPNGVISKDKIERSTSIMSEAYASRGRACEILTSWNGDMKDKTTKDRYIAEADRVQRLTISGLGSFLAAAAENGLDKDDLRQLVSEKLLTLQGDSIGR